tara:strand:+ start:245 stop:547 length:303 start_codon:yes stop_codon:yes gene_type:complete
MVDTKDRFAIIGEREKMFYKLYIRESCPYCQRAVEFLVKNGIQHTLIIDNDGGIIKEAKNNYNWPTVPIVIEVDKDQNETLVGGYTDMRKYFKNKGVKNV